MGEKIRIEFERKISKTAGKLMITIPRAFYRMVEHGKKYKIIIEGPLEDK